jgi:hypothetical protein
MGIKSPLEYQPFCVPTEPGRVDVVCLGSDYAPDRKTMRFDNIYMAGDAAQDSMALVVALVTRPEAKTLFVNASESELEAIWQYLKEHTSLDVRFGTIGYNASGLTIYKE